MYRIVGADQKEYGPVTADQIHAWIKEGRANGQTLARFEEGPWKPLSTFPEFSQGLPKGEPPAIPQGGGAFPSSYAGGAPSSALSITGLVISVLGLLCCGPIFSTIGLLLCIIALFQIGQNPERYAGRGLAIAGIIVAILGYISFAILFSSGILEEITRELRNL